MLANSTCINAAKHPEKLIELILRQEGLESVRSAPYDKAHPGAYGAALAESKKLPKASADDRHRRASGSRTARARCRSTTPTTSA